MWSGWEVVSTAAEGRERAEQHMVGISHDSCLAMLTVPTNWPIGRHRQHRQLVPTVNTAMQESTAS